VTAFGNFCCQWARPSKMPCFAVCQKVPT